MGLGRKWSKGHGNEFAILTEAFSRATDQKIARFRTALENGEPIMDARAILHVGVPLTRTSMGGNRLGDWDPAVTQFRWYNPTACFWLPRTDEPAKSSRPYQIDLIMREALLACCALWFEGYREFHFCGVCERPEFLIRYNTSESADGKRARFWVEVPDHWASYDNSGGDREEREMAPFLQPWGAEEKPDGGVVRLDGQKGAELVEGQPFDPAVFAAGDEVEYTVLSWGPGGVRRADPQIGGDPPAGELRRLDTMRRLREEDRWALNTSPVLAAAGADAVVAGPEAVIAPSTALHAVTTVSTPSTVPSSSAASSTGGRYGRLFHPGLGPDGLNQQVREGEVTAIAKHLVEPGKELIADNQYIDAIYTFFGQFVDHDITFDSASSLQRSLDPDELVDFRTPHLDLDSIYGGGPRQQPYLYDQQGRFVLGKIDFAAVEGKMGAVPPVAWTWPDLPRNHNGVALVADPRNDQQAILSQLTVLFLRFHNAIIDRQPVGLSVEERFARAQREVRWHYQWLVLQHFLPTAIGPHKAASYLWAAGDRPTGPELVQALREQLVLPIVRPSGEMFLPVEFSAAAFRFGHSMVRSTYEIFEGSGPRGILDVKHGLVGQPVPVDWGYFVRGVGEQGHVQQSALIDTRLIPEFGNLPGGLVAGGPMSLPERTLLRGLRLHLPSGQTVATELRARGYRDVYPLAPKEIGLESMLAATETPLWYYILREAEFTRSGYRLGPVGATLVAEVLLGLLVHDETSFLHHNWGPEGGDFTFADLVNAAGWPRKG